MKPGLVLIVIKSADIENLKDFYEEIGLVFQAEQHGKGPVHYSSVLNGIVFEIYPLYQDETPSLNRLGFEVQALDELVEKLKSDGVKIISSPKNKMWGYMAIIEDPEGRKVELHQRPE